MSTEFRRGLAVAAKHLRATAADYDQMAAQIQQQNTDTDAIFYRMRRARAGVYLEMAALLRGQAEAILEQRP